MGYVLIICFVFYLIWFYATQGPWWLIFAALGGGLVGLGILSLIFWLFKDGKTES